MEKLPQGRFGTTRQVRLRAACSVRFATLPESGSRASEAVVEGRTERGVSIRRLSVGGPHLTEDDRLCGVVLCTRGPRHFASLETRIGRAPCGPETAQYIYTRVKVCGRMLCGCASCPRSVSNPGNLFDRGPAPRQHYDTSRRALCSAWNALYIRCIGAVSESDRDSRNVGRLGQ